MLKSILLLLGGAVVLSPLAVSGRTPHQDSAQPASAAQTTPQAAAGGAAGMAADTKNPVKPTSEGMAKAKELYTIDCAMCHGDKGDGKTDLATSMEITPKDFTDAKAMADQKDGELFNVIRAGKGKMPGEDPARAKDPDVWNLVTYVRNFSKTQAVVTPAPARPGK